MADEPEQTGDKLDARLTRALAEALSPEAPDASAHARMRYRILAHAGWQETEVVRAGSGEWQELLPGIRIKTLRLDRAGGTQTSLWELQPGSRIPAHTHAHEEECLVIEGSLNHGNETYTAGDYLYARSGVKHEEFYSATGATLLIRSAVVPTTSRLTRFLFGLIKP